MACMPSAVLGHILGELGNYPAPLAIGSMAHGSILIGPARVWMGGDGGWARIGERIQLLFKILICFRNEIIVF